MTSWTIDEPATRAILDAVEDHLSAFDRAGSDVNDAVGELVAQTAGLRTASALETFASDPMLIGLVSASEHAYSAVGGTRGALDVYVAGQEEMAASMERDLAPRLAP